jgi:hypothetical protein
MNPFGFLVIGIAFVPVQGVTYLQENCLQRFFESIFGNEVPDFEDTSFIDVFAIIGIGVYRSLTAAEPGLKFGWLARRAGVSTQKLDKLA